MNGSLLGLHSLLTSPSAIIVLANQIRFRELLFWICREIVQFYELSTLSGVNLQGKQNVGTYFGSNKSGELGKWGVWGNELLASRILYSRFLPSFVGGSLLFNQLRPNPAHRRGKVPASNFYLYLYHRRGYLDKTNNPKWQTE